MEKIIVDQDVCIGCGFCAGNLEEVFEMDSNDLAKTKENNNNLDQMNEEIKEKSLDILEGCPVGAIKTEKEN